MSSLLVHITCGPENPTRAALAFFVARAAVEAGHEVHVFIAGDGVPLMRDAVLDNLRGLGTGDLREHYEKIVAGGGKFYLSGMSSKVRGLMPAELEGKAVTMGAPDLLVKLLMQCDRSIVY